MKEITCKVEHLIEYVAANQPIRIICSADTEVTIDFNYSDVYDRGGARELWEAHEYGKLYGIPVVTGFIPRGKVKLIFE